MLPSDRSKPHQVLSRLVSTMCHREVSTGTLTGIALGSISTERQSWRRCPSAHVRRQTHVAIWGRRRTRQQSDGAR
jgi:hypothetical protein